MFIFINFTEFYSYNFNGALFSFVLEKGSRWMSLWGNVQVDKMNTARQLTTEEKK